MPVTKTESRQRLEAIKERKRAAREKLNEKRKALAAAEKMQDADIQQALKADISETQDEIELCTALELNALRGISGMNTDVGRNLASDPQAQNVLREIAGSSAEVRANIHVGDLLSQEETVDLFGRAMAGPVDIPSTDFPASFGGIVTPPTPPTSLLDLFRAVPADGRRFDYLRRSGVPQADIAPHGTIKPEAGVEYEPAEVEWPTIAAWIKVNRQDLDDLDALTADLATALRYGVLRRAERLLVEGTAGPPAIAGLSTTGTLAPDLTGITNTADAVSLAIAEMALTGVDPNVTALNPRDAHDERIRKDANGNYLHTIDGGRMWNKPVVESVAVAQGEALVTDSTIAAVMGVRSGVSVVVGQESDDFVRNRVTVLAEARMAPIVQVSGATALLSPLPAG